jgi:myo-inositol-1(or 4)-monophosphatase
MSAGLLIVREAGGYATDPDGGDPRTSGDVVAANPHLHPVLRDAVANGIAASHGVGHAASD